MSWNWHYGPGELYAIELYGDDLSHLSQLVADDRGLEDDCLACARIRNAIATARYVETHDPVRPAA